jgi:DNA-binding transcriptional LysR family regulator
MPAADLQLDWVRAFVAVVDAGSLTAAAPLVHRSQSALSMQLKKLEGAVGRPVLNRGPRHLELTPTGLELLGHARRLLEVHAQAQAALHGPALTGRVSMGVPDDYAAAYLTPVLRSFATRHAGVEITLVCEQSTALLPKISRGEIDLALVSRDRGEPRHAAVS